MITETMKPRTGVSRGGPNRFATLLLLAVFGIGSMYYIYSAHTELLMKEEMIGNAQKQSDGLASQLKMLKDNKIRRETELDEEIKQLGEEKKNLERTLREEQGKLESEKEQLQEEKDQVQEELQEIRNSLADLRQEFDDVSRQNIQLKEEKVNLQEEMEEMQSKKEEEIAKAEEESNRLRKELEAAQSESHKLKKEFQLPKVDSVPSRSSKKPPLAGGKPNVLAAPNKAPSSTQAPKKKPDEIEAEEAAVLPMPINKDDIKGKDVGLAPKPSSPKPPNRYIDQKIAAQLAASRIHPKFGAKLQAAPVPAPKVQGYHNQLAQPRLDGVQLVGHNRFQDNGLGKALQQGEEGDYGEDQGEKEDEVKRNSIGRDRQKHFNDFEDTMGGEHDKHYDLGNADGQEGDDEMANYQGAGDVKVPNAGDFRMAMARRMLPQYDRAEDHRGYRNIGL